MFASIMLAGLAASAQCSSLTTFAAPGVTVTHVEIVPAGPATTAGRGAAPARSGITVPEHCRVTAVLKPSSDSNIQMELWLPTETWNGKFQAVGNGGWAGTISFAAMADALRNGYATASTDTGHTGATGSAAFAVNHPEKVTDFAYRAIHEMTITSKALIRAFYERPARLSYFNGCSTGGRQGMMEAQRFPDDYDGIVAGAPVYNQIHLSASQLARQVDALKNRASMLTPDNVKLLADAAIAACDGNDGVRDGLISNPERCAFEPATLVCKAGGSATPLDAGSAACLTPAQVETVNRAYAGVATTTGDKVYPGSARGFEAGLRMPDAPMELHFAPFRDIGRQDASWNPMSFDLERDLALTLKNASGLEATDPNLARFKARGGKLLLYHGWADPGPAPAGTIAYYSAVDRTLGGKQDGWMRLFMLPGVGHCGGGAGPDQADFMAALERWREAGIAPDRVEAMRVRNNRVDMTRPLCPYPQVAQYKGAGSTNDAANFVCKNP
jgi:feruloyl esterase